MGERIKGERVDDNEMPVELGGYSKWTASDRPHWKVRPPVTGIGIGNLINHHVEEHEDGTISVVPGGGGTSNSILLRGAHGKSWHGYIYQGEWEEA